MRNDVHQEEEIYYYPSEFRSGVCTEVRLGTENKRCGMLFICGNDGRIDEFWAGCKVRPTGGMESERVLRWWKDGDVDEDMRLENCGYRIEYQGGIVWRVFWFFFPTLLYRLYDNLNSSRPLPVRLLNFDFHLIAIFIPSHIGLDELQESQDIPTCSSCS